mgnify:FL=1
MFTLKILSNLISHKEFKIKEKNSDKLENQNVTCQATQEFDAINSTEVSWKEVREI